MVSRTAMLLFVAAALVGAVAAQASDEERWAEWKARYGKMYATADADADRFAVFSANLRKIADLNAANTGAYYSANEFADLSADEFDAKYKGYKRMPELHRAADMEAYEAPAGETLPKKVDWRTKGDYVTPIKNQEQCGSCWAFSVTEEVESVFAIAGNGLKVLSPQQIVSCDGADAGCGGGDPISAYKYIEKAGGLESEAEYPYTSGGGDSGSCHFKHNKITANITGFKYATTPSDKDETQMQSAVANIAPLSICVDASSWQFYSGGVISSGCGQQLDHCVQATGYTMGSADLTDDDSSVKGDYWVVRNSWGGSWGYDGYLYVEIGKNLCGIADEATYVTCK